MMSTVLTNLSSDVLEACSGFFAEVKPQFADQENGTTPVSYAVQDDDDDDDDDDDNDDR